MGQFLRLGRREVTRALEAEEKGLDPRLEFAGVERLGKHVVGPDFEEADAVRHVIGLGDADDRDGRQGRRGPDLPADVGRGAVADHHVDDHELVGRDTRQRLGRIGQEGDRVPDTAQDVGQDSPGGEILVDEEDVAARHGDPAG